MEDIISCDNTRTHNKTYDYGHIIKKTVEGFGR